MNQPLPKPRRNSHFLNLSESGRLSEQLPFDQSVSEQPQLRAFANPTLFPNRDTRIDPSRDRVVIFIDGSNLFYAASHLNLEVDYVKLLNCLTKGRRLVRAYFYTGIDPTNERQQGFLLWMRRNGYRVIAKELIHFQDGSKKANLEVEIAVDMMTLANYCDAVVLLSGNGDLTYVANSLSYQGVRVEVVSLHSMTSDSLINVADCYTDLATIQHDIRR
ncbi:MAG: NYN domain-containing protein [Leptolyngbyaceae cyanobacterium RU_5_1]|nr:NYN domain-containing protein [Leptolyngbyaceae cyanobacterium RU_5_1]